MSNAAAQTLESPPCLAAETGADDPEVIEIVQKRAFSQAAILRLSRSGLRFVGRGRTRRLPLDAVRKLRLEGSGQPRARRPVRLVVSGTNGSLIVTPGRTVLPSPSPGAVSAAVFADRCVTRVLAASPACALLIGTSEADYTAWIIMACAAAIFVLLAVLLVASGTPWSDVTGVAPILAMLPACWVNLRAGRAQDVSEADLRAAIARSFAPATP